MPSSVLVPMHVEAKVTEEEISVPALAGDPFNESSVLEAGVHVHWALPDALTRARFVDTDEGRQTLFPGVPDLWLVVRFNPAPTGSGLQGVVVPSRPTPGRAVRGRGTVRPTGGGRLSINREATDSISVGPATQGTRPNAGLLGPAKRSWRAWVVDSRSSTATPLDDWEPSDDIDAQQIHTFTGMLPSAASIGEAGWGMWNAAEHGSFDPAVAAYYPTARGRFGFHDPLDDLVAASGSITYSVVGWYADPSLDPLFASPDRRAQLKKWKFSWKTGSRGPLKPLVSAEVVKASFIPKTASLQKAPPKRVSKAGTTMARTRKSADRVENARNTARLAAVRQSMTDLVAAVSESGSAAGISVGHVVGATVPGEIVCHGAISEVPLTPPVPEPVTFEHGQVSAYPSVKTAMAAVASLDQSGNTDMVEALLQNLDGQQAKTQGGVLDIPGALHALSFQGAPGRSRFFAQIDVWAPKLLRGKDYGLVLSSTVALASQGPSSAMTQASSDVGVSGPTGAVTTRRASGHWPQISARSASAASASSDWLALPDNHRRTPQTVKPYEPTEGELDEWIADVQAALAEAGAGATSEQSPVDAAIVRVLDHRKDAAPLLLGPSAGGRGADGASYWLDTEDRDAVRRLLIAVHGANVGLPRADKLHEVPGPRWYRPWSPHIVVAGQGRSFRFGEDGRFDTRGMLRCRVSGETLVSIKTDKGKVVLAKNIVANTSALSTHAGLPPEVRPLVEEVTLLDAENGGVMARLSQPDASGAALEIVKSNFTDASHALVLLRDPSLSASHRAQILSLVKGREPSPVAFLPWRDPWDPLFLDVAAAHPFSSLENDWTIDGEGAEPPSVEYRPLSGDSTQPPAGQVELFEERTLLTSTIVHTLESALITNITLDKYGNPIPSGPAPGGMDEQTFKKMAVLSAPLTGFDQMLMDRGYRERTGALRLNKIDIVDSFGARRTWSSGIPNPASTGGNEDLPWWTALPPRLPMWSRLQFRLMSAVNGSAEATFKDSPLCGFLIPDLFEHSLEVYDAAGRALGQIRSDPPQRGSDQAVTLNAWFEVHPWTAEALGMDENDNPLDAVSNDRLRAFVAGVVSQNEVVVPANQGQSLVFETAQTALMRILDTLRSSVDSKEKIKNQKVRLVGDPIAVLAANVWLEATGETAPAALKGPPTNVSQPPAVPTIKVQVGDQNRPDDGVLGCFIPAADPAASHFAPVSTEAAEKAILNELPVRGISSYPATHPFVDGLESVFPVSLGERLDLTVLVEAGASLHAISGALPRKKVSVPKEFLAGVERLEPTFRVGPLLSIPAFGSLSPILPAPQVEGHDVDWLRFEPGANQDTGEWRSTPVPSVPPLGSVPPKRVHLSEGWMRLTRSEAPQDP